MAVALAVFFDLDAELFTIFHPSALDLADTLEEVHLEVPDLYVNVPVTLTYHCTELLWMYRPVFDFVTVFEYGCIELEDSSSMVKMI